MADKCTTRAIACAAPHGGGGLGQHFAQIVEEARSQGILASYYTSKIKPDDRLGKVVTLTTATWINRTFLRYSPGWKNYLIADSFDCSVAAKLTPVEEFEGFGGLSLNCFKKVRQLGCERLYLQAANSHVTHVMHQHKKATQRFGIEASWLNQAQCRKTLREYEMADIIYCASEYTRQTFLAQGFNPSKLQRITLKPDPRFMPPPERPNDGVFRVVYVGSLTVAKGIPILLEAFSRLQQRNAELTLVGGYGTPGMRRYIQSWSAHDPRIRLAPGDPLPHLQKANVYVHPSYEDGFAYSAIEAMACGVPTVVTEDTGMKECVKQGVNGYVIPTDDWEALLEILTDYQIRL